MNILRRLPLSHLLLACTLVVALGAGATAFATALSSGPTPPPKPLANAIHDALAAPPVAGVSARFTLTNHLIEDASLASQSGDGGPGKASPLLTGGSGRLWISASGKARLELQSESGDTEVLYDGQTLTVFEASANTLYRVQLPKDANDDPTPAAGNPAAHKLPTVEEIQRTITRLMGHVTLSGATPGDVAGQPAYSVRISPSHDGGLVGGAELAWDAVHGVPLRLALYATSSTAPVLELSATDISYEAVPDSVFALSLPAGAKVHELSTPGATNAGEADSGTSSSGSKDDSHKADASIKGAAAVQASIPFTLDAPATLAGMAQTEVRGVKFDSRPAALVTYGHGLAGIAVVEVQAKGDEGQGAGEGSSGADEGPDGASLPKVSINGTDAGELPTALGTLLELRRGGIDYTLAGSVTRASIEAAARGL